MRKTLATLLLSMLLLTAGAYCQSPSTLGNITAAASTCTPNNGVSTNGACVSLTVPPSTGGITVNIQGTYNATNQFEASTDGVNFVAINGTPLNSTTAATSTTSTGIWQFNAAGVTIIRVRASAYTSGAASVNIQASSASARSGGGGSGGGISSINGDTASAQIIAGAGTVSCSTASGTTTCTGTGGAGGFTLTPVVKTANYSVVAADFSSSTTQMNVLTLPASGVSAQATFTLPPSSAMPPTNSCIVFKNDNTTYLLQLANGTGTTGGTSTLSSNAYSQVCVSSSTTYELFRTVINPSLIGSQITCLDSTNTDTYTCATPNIWQFNFADGAMLNLDVAHTNTGTTLGSVTVYVSNNPGNATAKNIVKTGPGGALVPIAAGDLSIGANLLIFNAATQYWVMQNPATSLSVPVGYTSGDIPVITAGALGDSGVLNPSSGVLNATCYESGGANCNGAGTITGMQQTADGTPQIGAAVIQFRTTFPYLKGSQNNSSFGRLLPLFADHTDVSAFYSVSLGTKCYLFDGSGGAGCDSPSGGGGGNFSGPSSSVANDVVGFADTTGHLGYDTGVRADHIGTAQGTAGITFCATVPCTVFTNVPSTSGITGVTGSGASLVLASGPTINNLTCTGTPSGCGTPGGATIATTKNLIEGDNAGNGIAS